MNIKNDLSIISYSNAEELISKLCDVMCKYDDAFSNVCLLEKAKRYGYASDLEYIKKSLSTEYKNTKVIAEDKSEEKEVNRHLEIAVYDFFYKFFSRSYEYYKLYYVNIIPQGSQLILSVSWMYDTEAKNF